MFIELFFRITGASENTPADKNMFKVDNKKGNSNASGMLFSLGKFLKYVTKPCFRKSSGLSINRREGVCDGV